MLRVEGVDAYYGLSHVLQGVSLTVEPGEAVAPLHVHARGMGLPAVVPRVRASEPPQHSV